MTWTDTWTDTWGDPMAIFGCDYSYSRDAIDIAAMARDGVKFACRYLRDGSKTGKALLPAEAARLRAAGIAVVSNDETTGTQYVGGFDGGRRDAAAAWAAHVACGGPSNGRPIYFTPLDHDPAGLDAAGWDLLRSYARGVVDVLGPARVGWYGGTAMLRDLRARGLGRWWWQSLGWRGGVWLDWAHIQQYDNGNQRWNGEVDYDRALQADYGQWGVEDMPLDDTDLAAVEARFRNVLGMSATGSMAIVQAGQSNNNNAFKVLADRLVALKSQVTGLATLVQGEEDQTQAAIAALSLTGADPAAIAAAVLDGLGPELAGQVAAELATRLQA